MAKPTKRSLHKTSIKNTTKRLNIGLRHYEVIIPIIDRQTRKLQVYTRRGIILDSSSRYLHRVIGKNFSEWLDYAFAAYGEELQIKEIPISKLDRIK